MFVVADRRIPVVDRCILAADHCNQVVDHCILAADHCNQVVDHCILAAGQVVGLVVVVVLGQSVQVEVDGARKEMDRH